MRPIFNYSLICCSLFLSSTAIAQKIVAKKVIPKLKADIEFLASDELEGRRAASEGERKAAIYLENEYKKLKISPYQGNYQHPFHFTYGKEIAAANQIILSGKKVSVLDGVFPMPFSANSKSPIISEVLPDIFEQGNIWLTELYSEQADANDPHFDVEKQIYEKAKTAAQQGAAAIIFYDNVNAKYPPTFNAHSDFEALDIPVVFMSHQAFEQYVKPKKEGVLVSLNTTIQKSEFNGLNVAAFIDNKQKNTVIIGAHFDHLGYGENGSSLYAGKDKSIHNGADDNASGTAGVLQLATWVKAAKLRQYNYLFINFSAEELGLLGSKAFVKNLKIDSSNVAYMINMDMIGRLNDSTHALTVGGVGTSPVWSQFVPKIHKDFKIVIDSSGVGPSDHTSFYHAGIPVLFLFTGLHTDYHKPSDDADKINYEGEFSVLKYAFDIIKGMDKLPKPTFTPTKQSTVGKVRFKVTLGIMPDYSFQDGGVRADGVSEDKPAAKAGIKAGDIIIQMEDKKIQGMQSYMEALASFKSGQTIKITVMREGKPMVLNLTF